MVCIGSNLRSSTATTVLDAEGGYVTPGGVDSHVHLEQPNTPTGDTWETGSRSAVCGGTTTILAFVFQTRQDGSLLPLVDDYTKRAKGNSYADYGFHLILTNPTPDILEDDIPLLARERGITSLKLYMTYSMLSNSLVRSILNRIT